MRRRSKVLITVAAVAGIIAGAVVALVVPDSETDRGADMPAVKLPPTEPVSIAPAAHERQWDVVWTIPSDSVGLEAQTPDPRGGPDWALRTYDAKRSIKRPGPDLGVGHYRCAQLGRIYNGKFGWLDPKGVFRPVDLRKDIWSGCRSQREDRAGKPFLQFIAMIADPDQGASAVYQTVVWGLAGRGAKSGALHLGGNTEQQLRFGPSGAFLHIGSGDLHENQVSLEVRGADGDVRRTPTAMAGSDDLGLAHLPANLRKKVRGRPIGPSHVEVRTADPGGGLPWGISATKASDGGWCLSQAGRIIGDRVGGAQPRAGTMTESFPSALECSPGFRPSPTRRRPVNIGWMYMRDQGPMSRARRSQRRTQADRTIFSGTTHPDVKYLTIATPRDVRTLEPSPRAHAFVVAYDDTFPTGQVILTATFADGSTRVQRIDATPF